MDESEVPVLIVGGGGCGLSSSAFLSDLGVEHMLVERRFETSDLPKAHYLNQRTMEVLRNHGMADAVYAVGTPIENFGHVRWRTSLGGDGPLDARDFMSMDAFGGGELRPAYTRDSPCEASNYPQLRFEPLLRGIAEERAPGAVRFGHELVGWEQDEDGVAATVLDRSADERLRIRARYMIAADGGRSVGPGLGVAMPGPTGMVDMVSTHFSADLSEWVDDKSLITWFMNPEGAAAWDSGAMVQMGPTWGRHSEEWVVHFAFGPDDPARFDEEAIVPRLRALLKLPELELTVHKVSHWILDRIVAERLRIDSIFLAGDAAHRQPPTTGLGLNTAIQDAHNLCWKLAAVLRGEATDSLLDSYESERLPVGTTNADWALMSFTNHAVIDAGLGLMPGAPPEQNSAAMAALFAETRIGAALRARAEDTIGTQAMEFQARGIEIGFNYEQGALASDGSEPPAREPKGLDYVPTTRPGHRLPHAWLGRGGERVSTHDLVRPGRFLLLTGPDGAAWVEAADALARELGIGVDARTIGDGADLADVEGRWALVREIDDGGALLVRPDQHVGWRSERLADDPAAELRTALGAILT